MSNPYLSFTLAVQSASWAVSENCAAHIIR